MNILVTTLGYSWHIVPELLGFTNPNQYDMYACCPEVKQKQQSLHVFPVDECWVVTVDDNEKMQNEINSLVLWARTICIDIRIFVCNGVKDFPDESSIRMMRSFIFRTVLVASEKTKEGKLYLSLAGGRKTMSADMQEAANLFGCDLLLHVVDILPLPDELRKDPKANMLNDYSMYGKYFLPLVIKHNVLRNPILNTGYEIINSSNFPLCLPNAFEIRHFSENVSLLQEVERRKEESDRLYRNFLSNIGSIGQMRRDAFRALYVLDPEIIGMLQSRIIGGNEEQDTSLIQLLPKCDLHSHLGGVLSPVEILSCVMQEKSLIRSLLLDESNRNYYHHIRTLANNRSTLSLVDEKQHIPVGNHKTTFERNLMYISALSDHPDLFAYLVQEPYIHNVNFTGIGIEAYQKLGDFQGSRLLQTEGLIRNCCSLYAKKLIADGVEYVEIRCSPYKYCEYGLTFQSVMQCILDEMDKFGIIYRIIVILGRASSKQEISERIEEVIDLYRTNTRFAEKFVGVDLAGTEGTQRPSELRECFIPLLRECIHITIHAGETESVENIWEAVYYLAADRIGHGLRLLEKPELLIRFLDKNIGIELCPSSNDQIVGYPTGYPLKSYMQNGLKVTINTDNCGISQTSVSKEFYIAGKLCGGITLWDCLVLIRNSISVAFLDVATRKKMMIKFEDRIRKRIHEGAFL